MLRIKTCICLVAAFSLFSQPIQAQLSESTAPKNTRRGDGAGYGTRDATVLSMMGWGLGLGLGIALLCGFIENSTAH